MKSALPFFLILLQAIVLPGSGGQKANNRDQVKIILSNPANINRSDELIAIPLKTVLNAMNLKTEKPLCVTDQGKVFQAEIVRNYENKGDCLVFCVNLKPKETKTVSITAESTSPIPSEKYTQAYLGVKSGYKLDNGYYMGGKFESARNITVPKTHFAHDALLQYEGPGWESDKIAYRLYLDSRNRTDIFVKKTGKMVVHEIGVNDLISDSKESYTKMQEWGMDMFKVGSSLGIGTFGAFAEGRVATVSETDSVKCAIQSNGNLFSEIKLNYYGWKIGNLKNDLQASFAICAHSRLTEVTLKQRGAKRILCTGFAKHDGTSLIDHTPNSENKWGYTGQWGKQSLTGDLMGLAVFYQYKDRPVKSADSSSVIITMTAKTERLKYYFAACWEGEQEGIKTKEEFEALLNTTIDRLNSPIAIKIIK